MWGSKVHAHKLIDEDMDCLRDWENYTLLGRLPHELGITPEPYHEDIEALKQMKKWMQQREERERKKEEARRKTHERMKKDR